jgi:hypothetical protein
MVPCKDLCEIELELLCMLPLRVQPISEPSQLQCDLHARQ